MIDIVSVVPIDDIDFDRVNRSERDFQIFLNPPMLCKATLSGNKEDAVIGQAQCSRNQRTTGNIESNAIGQMHPFWSHFLFAIRKCNKSSSDGAP